MLAIACLFCLVNVHGQGHALDINESYSFGWRMGNALISYVAYLGQSVCPAGLAPIYPRRPSFLSPWQIGGAIRVLAAITAATSACWRKRPWLLVGWLWYAGMLVPVIGLVQFGAQAEADRYTYLPQIGLTLAVVWTASELWWGGKGKDEGGRVSDQWRDSPPRRGDAESAPSPGLCAPAVSDLPRLMPHPSSFSSFFRQTGAAAAASLLAVLVVSAWRQTSYWRDSEALWTHTLGCTSQNALAHYNLALALTGSRRIEEATAHFQTTLEIDPDNADAHNNLGFALLGRGRTDEAMAHFQQALTIRPDYAQAHYNLGLALAGRGRFDEAIAHYQEALEIEPNDADAHNNLGLALAGRGQIDEAMAQYHEALKIRPDFAEAHINLGLALAGRGRFDEAMAQYRKTLEIKPRCAEAHIDFGTVLATCGRIDEAISHLRKALQIEPDNAQAHNNLGLVLASRERVDESIEHFQRALEIEPDNAVAHKNLGLVLAGRGRLDEAIVYYRKALVLAQRQHNVALADELKARLRPDEAGTPRPQPPQPSDH